MFVSPAVGGRRCRGVDNLASPNAQHPGLPPGTTAGHTPAHEQGTPIQIHRAPSGNRAGSALVYTASDNDTPRRSEEGSSPGISGDSGSMEQRGRCFRGGLGRDESDDNHGHGQQLRAPVPHQHLGGEPRGRCGRQPGRLPPENPAERRGHPSRCVRGVCSLCVVAATEINRVCLFCVYCNCSLVGCCAHGHMHAYMYHPCTAVTGSLDTMLLFCLLLQGR